MSACPEEHRGLSADPDEEWVLRGSCRSGGVDDTIWFPDRKNGVRIGKRVCNGPAPDRHPELGCPVRQQCLQHALDNDLRWGTWGGLDMWERAELLKRRSPFRSFGMPAKAE